MPTRTDPGADAARDSLTPTSSPSGASRISRVSRLGLSVRDYLSALSRLDLADLYGRTPWWAKVLVIFAASRIVTTTLLLIFASMQAQNAWTGASPHYVDFASIWDGHWYYIVSVSGYPSDLPLTADGHVAENAWAFMPAYPMLVNALMWLTGLGFG